MLVWKVSLRLYFTKYNNSIDPFNMFNGCDIMLQPFFDYYFPDLKMDTLTQVMRIFFVLMCER